MRRCKSIEGGFSNREKGGKREKERARVDGRGKPQTPGMSSDDGMHYTKLSEERIDHFINNYMVTTQLDPESDSAYWPDIYEKIGYLPIFAAPWAAYILPYNMTLLAEVRSSPYEFTPGGNIEEFDDNSCIGVPSRYEFLRMREPNHDMTSDDYKQRDPYRFHTFSITDRVFDMVDSDCFDLRFHGAGNSGNAKVAWMETGVTHPVPDRVSREFLQDVAQSVALDSKIGSMFTGGRYDRWINRFIREAVLRELVRAYVRKFDYVRGDHGIRDLRTWAEEQPSRTRDELDGIAEAKVVKLLRETPWWFLWATFVGYASIIRFPENRERLRNRVPTFDPAVWPLPNEEDLSGPMKSDYLDGPPASPAPAPAPPPAPTPPSAPPTTKVYRLNRKRAVF